MKIKIDHQAGQYRAELFEDLIFYLLGAVFSESMVIRGFILPKIVQTSLSLDFVVWKDDRVTVVVETKAPYTDSVSFGVNKTLRRVKDAFLRMHEGLRPKQVIVAIASELPAASAKEFESTKAFFEQHSVELTIWDAKKLTQMLATQLKLTIHSFSIANLEKALQTLNPEGSRRRSPSQSAEGKAASEAPIVRAGQASIIAGEHDDVLVLCADFCSYTKFVLASGGDRELISSVMGRFYRETRRIIEDAGGWVDKYMGDGILAFWMPSTTSDSDLGKRIETCASQLISCALGIAKEWQDQIDHSVEVVGMRVGAAVGKVLFIPELVGKEQPLHAISDYINLAARLQSAAKENSLVISNRLRKSCFDNDHTFQELEPLELKNFGQVVAWSKDYERA